MTAPIKSPTYLYAGAAVRVRAVVVMLIKTPSHWTGARDVALRRTTAAALAKPHVGIARIEPSSCAVRGPARCSHGRNAGGTSR
jgi:hypothetical protein